ncbi:MAG: MBL fold metallo-hydrolase [Bryobacteraceae bacterium]
MYFQQFYLGCLAHASYMIGSDGEVAVIDPQRDVEIYLDEAKKQGLRVAHVIETHLHADFVSGHRELAERTGAKVYLGADSGATFPHVPVRDGDELRVGRLRLRFLETPGHTVESICIVVHDEESGSPDPVAVFTGDTLFIGDVGRPDLSPNHTPAELAGLLYDSLHQKLLKLPDSTAVYPAHGAGSLCGRQISSEKASTIGRERQTNYALQPMSREQFIALLTDELPDRPDYFAKEVEINRTGAAPLAELEPLHALSAAEVEALREQGAVVLDTRPPNQFCAAHVPGSVSIALSGQFASWGGILLGLDAKVVLVAEEDERIEEARVRLARVGLENVLGFLEDGIQGWQASGRELASIPQITCHELHRALSEDPDPPLVIDVRNPAEWKAGHIAQAIPMPLRHVASRAGELDRSRHIAVHCKSGYRSTIAAGLLRRAGFEHVANVVGGFDAWAASQLPVTVDPAASSSS